MSCDDPHTSSAALGHGLDGTFIVDANDPAYNSHWLSMRRDLETLE